MTFNITKLLSVLMAFCLISTPAFSQKDTKKASNKSVKPEMEKISKDSLNILHSQIENLTAQIENLNKKNKSLEEQINALEGTISFQKNELASLSESALNHRVDSLEIMLSSKDSIITNFREREAFVDLCLVRAANRMLLDDSFDVENVNEAKTYFDRIYSTDVKKTYAYSKVQELVNCYEESYIEFMRILQQAQDDNLRKSMRYLLVPDTFITKYTKLIETMPYYINHYKSGYSIQYLNKLIDEAMIIIKNHSKDKPADFSYMIDYNVLKGEDNSVVSE